MEAILGLVGVFIFFFVVNLVIRGVSGTVAAAGRAAMGKGSFADNMNLQFKGMGPFEVRGTLKPKGTGPAPFDVYQVEARGIIPTSTPRTIRFLTSVLDQTDTEGKKPVWSMIDDFQESGSIAYRHSVDGGPIGPNQGFIGWVQVGVVLPEILVPARSGMRDLLVVTRIVDANLAPKVELGFGDQNDPAVLGVYIQSLKYSFAGKGYEEQGESADAATVIMVELAVAVATSDGEMEEAEGQHISAWITRVLSSRSGQRGEDLKRKCNDALVSAYGAHETGTLSLSSITERLNAVADTSLKYQAIELCLDVMVADGHAHPEEHGVIARIASALGLDYAEMQRMKDERVVTVRPVADAEEDLQAVLGIEPGWPADRIKKHLIAEFAKWNGRLNTLTDPAERENTQHMIDLIGKARKRYG